LAATTVALSTVRRDPLDLIGILITVAGYDDLPFGAI
jgi:hypothetical protein